MAGSGRSLLLALTAAVLLVVVSAAMQSQRPPPILGRATVIDGDTITLAHARVRIFAIDAPELAQPCYYPSNQAWACGLEAKQMLKRFLADDPVTCLVRDHDRYGRSVATCSVRGDDIGQEMVRQGMAVAYREYSLLYAGEERLAMAERRGIWVGRFERPHLWRQNNQRQQ